MPHRIVWAIVFVAVSFPPLPSWAAKSKKTDAPGLKVTGLSLSENGQSVFLMGVEAPGLYHQTPDQLASFFNQVKSAGGRVVKTNVFSAGKGQDVILTGPDQWDEKALVKLDQMVAAAKASGVRLILDLCAEKGSDGGKDAYASWAGSPNPGIFFIHYQCKDWYQHYAKMLLTRVNTVTGTAYGTDKTILAWDLIDNPRNQGGEPDGFNQWAATMGPFVRSLAPHALVCLALGNPAEGINPNTASGQPGIDFVLTHPTVNLTASQWAQQIGKPVVSLLTKAEGKPSDLGAGVLVASGDSKDQWAATGSFLTGLSHEGGMGAKDLFSSVTASPEGDIILSWEGQEAIKVVLNQPAKVLVRYGSEGTMDQETPLSEEPALQHRITLSGLQAGKEYSYQVKAVRGGEAQFSNTSSFTMSKVKAILAKPIPRSNHFIKVKGPYFYDGEKRFRYVGTNNYYLHYQGGPETLEYIFSWCEKLGFTVMRTWAFGETTKKEKDWADWEKRRYFVTAPGQFREEAFKDMDKVVVAAAKHHQRLVMALANNWADFGGAPEWVKFFGLSDKNEFFKNKQVIAAFKEYVKAMVNHVNTITGVAYKDDPTIMAWDLMNEPRDEGDTTGKTLAAWIEEMSTFLKSLGIRQLVTTGSEGLRATNGTHYSGTDFILDHQFPSIDYATFHVYPSTQYSMWNLATTQELIRAYVKDAHEVLKKPVVMEEFGIDKGRPDYDRPQFVYGMMKAFYDAGGDGTQYWMLAEPNYGGDNNQLDPTQTDICNTFVEMSNALRGGKGNE
ncbi:MAG TPA: cellulase family glycosylhydrolase [bacterium]|nr:cellulase family glycosylhydrolase [bacterium]